MGCVRLMKSGEIGLKDEIQLFEDGLRTGKESGNYEWWYFDSFSRESCDVRIGGCRICGDLKHSADIYANKKDGYKATPVFMLARDGEILTGDAQKYLKYEEKDFRKDPYTKRYVARTLVYEYNETERDIHYRITYRKGNEEVDRQTMRDIVGKPLAALFWLLGFRGSYHRMGGTVLLEKFENGQLTERKEAPAMWEQMCFKPDRIK